MWVHNMQKGNKIGEALMSLFLSRMWKLPGGSASFFFYSFGHVLSRRLTKAVSSSNHFCKILHHSVPEMFEYTVDNAPCTVRRWIGTALETLSAVYADMSGADWLKISWEGSCPQKWLHKNTAPTLPVFHATELVLPNCKVQLQSKSSPWVHAASVTRSSSVCSASADARTAACLLWTLTAYSSLTEGLSCSCYDNVAACYRSQCSFEKETFDFWGTLSLMQLGLTPPSPKLSFVHSPKAGN